MTNNFKPGDLALIVGCRKDPVDIGKCVELVEFMEPGAISEWRAPSHGKRVENCTGFRVWLVASDALLSSSGCHGYTLCQEKHLQPLRGNFAPEQQKAKEAEPCA